MSDLPKDEQQIIDQIFGEAIELPLEARRSFLGKACAGQPPRVRERVDRLLAHDLQVQADAQFLAQPPLPIGELSPTTSTVTGQQHDGAPKDVHLPSAVTDRNLFFGIAALQFDFITRDQLITAMHSWVLTKHRPLGEILVEQSALALSDQQMLDAMVDRNLDLHKHDIQRSLARLSSISSLQDDLLALGDRDVDKTLAIVSATEKEDSQQTETWAHGTTTGRRFRVLRDHRKGGMGKVSYAKDAELNREVALKQIQDKYADEPASRARFVFEAEITGGLEHPGVVPVYGLGHDDDGRPFYAMRFIDGDRLTDAIARFHDSKRGDKITGERAMEFRNLLKRFVDVCDAVEYAHSRGVLHRDLKPQNIMLGKYGETLVVDWGLAKVVGREERSDQGNEPTLRPPMVRGSAPTLRGAAHGTIGYMSPEQAKGRVNELGRTTDVYSLGSILYTVLTGKPTFESSQENVLDKIAQGEFPSPRSLRRIIPRPLEAICLKALSIKPADRYQAASQISHDVERWLADEPVSVFSEPWPARLQRFARRHRTAVICSSLLVFSALTTLAIVSGLTIRQNRRLNRANAQVTQNYELAEKERRRAETNLDSTKTLAFRLLSVAEDELSRVGGKELLRHQLTSEVLKQFQDLHEQREGDLNTTRQLARVHLMLANVERTFGKHDSSEANYRDAIQYLQKLRSTTGEVEVTDLLAETFRDMAAMLKGLGRFRESASALARARSLSEELQELHPNDVRFERTTATVLMALASLQFELGDYSDCASTCEDAANLLRKLCKDDLQHDDRLLLVLCLVRYAEALREASKTRAAESALREALANVESLIDQKVTNDTRHAKARVLLSLAKTFADSGGLEQAGSHAADAIAIWERLSAEFSTYPFYRRYLADALAILGTLPQWGPPIHSLATTLRPEIPHLLVCANFRYSPVIRRVVPWYET